MDFLGILCVFIQFGQIGLGLIFWDGWKWGNYERKIVFDFFGIFFYDKLFRKEIGKVLIF